MHYEIFFYLIPVDCRSYNVYQGIPELDTTGYVCYMIEIDIPEPVTTDSFDTLPKLIYKELSKNNFTSVPDKMLNESDIVVTRGDPCVEWQTTS